MAPFLTVLTRTYRRPEMLAANQASLAAQTDPDYEQVLLDDPEGRGVAWANGRLREVGPLIRGEYVLILDDDDRLIYPSLIADLKRLATNRPPLVMTRMDHGERGVLPPVRGWGMLPERGQVGCSAAIVRADVWRKCAPAYGAAYDGDYDFLQAVFAESTVVIWHDRVVSAVQRISRGEPEVA